MTEQTIFDSYPKTIISIVSFSLLVDLDHEFPEKTLEKIINKRECGRNFYKFYRTDSVTEKIKGKHSNMFLISRARFMRFLGYDEEFAGHYGAEDFRFVKIQKYHGARQLSFNKNYRCFKRTDINKTKSYHNLVRDLSYNTPIDDRKKRETEMYGPESGYSRIFLNFQWKVVQEFHRTNNIYKKRRKFWKHLWFWRWLYGYD